MKDKVSPIKIYNFSHPLMNTEFYSVISDKFSRALPFSWEITNDYSSSDVVVWDGVITPKNASLIRSMIEDFKTTKILLLMGESMTLLKNHPIVQMVNLEGLKVVEVPGWNILPEEILSAIELCRERMTHV